MAFLGPEWIALALETIQLLSCTRRHNCDFQAGFVILSAVCVARGDNSISSNLSGFLRFLLQTLSLFVAISRFFAALMRTCRVEENNCTLV